MAVLLEAPYSQFFDDDGISLAGGKIYTYIAGSFSIPKVTWQDAGQLAQHANPIILDSEGRTQVFVLGSYNFKVTTAADVVIKQTENYAAYTTAASAASSFFQSFSGNNSQTTFTLSQNMGTDENAIQVFVDSGDNPPNGTPGVQTFSGTGAQTVFVLNQNVGTNGFNIRVYVSGLFTDNYTVNGTTLTITPAPASGSNNIKVVYDVYGKGREVLLPTQYTLNGTSLTLATAPPTGTNNILVFAPSTLVGAASASADAALISANAANASAASAVFASGNATALYNDFVNSYYGAAASDPALSPTGAPVSPGDLYFNTSSNVLRAYNGTIWQDVGLTNFLSTNVLTASAVSLTTGVTANVASLVLTTGDWDVWGQVITKPAGTTTTSQVFAGVNIASAALGTAGPTTFSYGTAGDGSNSSAAYSHSVQTGNIRVNVTGASQTIYLVTQVAFAVSTMGAFGFISARRN